MLKASIHLLAISFLLTCTPASAFVYTTGVSSAFDNGQGIIQAWTQPNLSGNGAGILCSIDSNLNLRPNNFTVGIGHVWYSVSSGTVIDPQFAMTAQPFANSFTGYLGGQIQMTLGGTFLLGFWLDANGNQGAGSGDRFGWASFRYDATGPTLLSSAIESTGAGIIAGTTAAVPEPSTICLFLLALTTVPYISRRRLQSTQPTKRRMITLD
ncbi:MAG: hypothetical protein ABI925_03945 [Verrucomicrobiota bacterium]